MLYYNTKRASSNYNEKKLETIKINSNLNAGIDRVIERLEKTFISLGKGYAIWTMLTNGQRRRLRYAIRKAIIEELLANDFKQALAKDCIGEDGIPLFSSNIYKHILKHWFRGSVRNMLRDLGKHI